LCILLERYTLFLQGKGACGDCMAESRQGKEDRRLKESFCRLWKTGSDFVGSQEFQQVLTSRELKVKPKSRNISGLQLSDLLAHPSRSEILSEERLLGRPVAPFARKVVSIAVQVLSATRARVWQEVPVAQKKRPIKGPMAFAIHLQNTGLLKA